MYHVSCFSHFNSLKKVDDEFQILVIKVTIVPPNVHHFDNYFHLLFLWNNSIIEVTKNHWNPSIKNFLNYPITLDIDFFSNIKFCAWKLHEKNIWLLIKLTTKSKRDILIPVFLINAHSSSIPTNIPVLERVWFSVKIKFHWGIDVVCTKKYFVPI